MSKGKKRTFFITITAEESKDSLEPSEEGLKEGLETTNRESEETLHKIYKEKFYPELKRGQEAAWKRINAFFKRHKKTG